MKKNISKNDYYCFIGSKEGVVRVSLNKLTLLLQKATKKRSTNPLEALLSSSNSEAEAKTKPSLFKDTQVNVLNLEVIFGIYDRSSMRQL